MAARSALDTLGTNLTWSGPIVGTGNLIKTGPGTLTLTSPASTYFSGTFIEKGTLAVNASGAVIPASTDVTVFSGGTFQIGPAANNAGNAIRTLTLSGGTMIAVANGGFYDLYKLVRTGGTVDFSPSTGFGFHFRFVGTGAGITIYREFLSTIWISGGSPISRTSRPARCPSTSHIAPPPAGSNWMPGSPCLWAVRIRHS